MKHFASLSFFALLSSAALAQALPSVVVAPRVVGLTFPAEAVVEAIQQATVAPQVPGRILDIRADAGQMVKKGEVLLHIDAREASEAAAAAQARLADAKAHLERTRSLFAQKFVSRAAVDRAQAEFSAAAANRGAAAAGQSHAVITSPITGLIARRFAEPGEMASPGKPLFLIYAPGGLRVTAYVPQYRVRFLRGAPGTRVEFPELGKWLDASAVQVLPTADAATHVSQVRIRLPDFPEAVPGMAARVHFTVGQAEKLTVPASAVLRRGEVAAVYVQTEDGRLTLRQLRLGETLGEDMEVLAGLSAGERVVTDAVKAGILLKQSAK